MQAVQKPPGNTQVTVQRLVVLFFLVYFAQKMGNNAEGPSKIPVRMALSAFGLSTDQAGAMLSAISVGWYIKAFLGAITDGLPIKGLRRKPWLLISNLGATAAWSYLALGGSSTLNGLFYGLVLVNIGVAFSDVIIDGLMVQSGQQMEREQALPEGSVTNRFQSMQWAGALTAILLASVAGGIIASVGSVSVSAAISAGVLLLLFPVIFMVKEERVAWDWPLAIRGFVGLGLAILVAGYYLWLNGQPDTSLDPGSMRRMVGEIAVGLEPYGSSLLVIGLMAALVRPKRAMWAPILLVFAWQATPFLRDSQVFLSYFTQDNTAFVLALKADTFLIPIFQEVALFLHIVTPEKLATDGIQGLFYGVVVEVMWAVGALLACWFGAGKWWSELSFTSKFQTCLVGNVVVFVLFTAFPMGATSPYLLLSVDALGGFVYMTAALAIMTYAGVRAPGTAQATAFAFLMGMSNLGQMLGVEQIGAKLYTYFGHQVTEGEGEKAITRLTDPNSGFLYLAMISLGYLLLLWLLIGTLRRRGFIDHTTT